MKNEKTIKFYVALWLAKLSTKVLKLLKRNATSFPRRFGNKDMS